MTCPSEFGVDKPIKHYHLSRDATTKIRNLEYIKFIKNEKVFDPEGVWAWICPLAEPNAYNVSVIKS